MSPDKSGFSFIHTHKGTDLLFHLKTSTDISAPFTYSSIMAWGYSSKYSVKSSGESAIFTPTPPGLLVVLKQLDNLVSQILYYIGL